MSEAHAAPCRVDPEAHARRVLEFSKVLALVASEARSAGGRARVLELLPSDDPAMVGREQALVREARAGLDAGHGPWPLDGLQELRAAVRAAERAGSRLDAAALRGIAESLDVSARLRRFLLERAEAMPLVAELARELQQHDALGDAIRAVIDERGELLDRASPQLAGIRRQMAQQRQAVLERLEAVLRASGAAADAYVTLRGERFVIPVRTDAQPVRGIVHDRSASGSTLFVEPLDVVDANNDLQRLRDAEQREIDRLLQELTAHVGADAGAILRTQDGLDTLDALHARAEFSRRTGAASPQHGATLRLRAARHPLLELQLVAAGGATVPLDLELGEARVLVITGPNTGGKTVALKTAGLLALMHQAGLQVPASPESELPVFERIVADIGDEQSIESAESTFSSHLRHVAEVLRAAGPRTLSLLDEFMAGTDPEEGAALAKVVLRKLAAAGGATLVTTHLGELKLFAHAEPGLANAGMRFDPQSRTPLFRLQPGVPGSSNAFATAARFGFDAALLDAARAERGAAAGQLESALEALELERLQLAQARRRAEEAEGEARRLREEHARALAELTAKRRGAQAAVRREAEQMLVQARASIERVVRELRESGASRDSIQAARDTLASLDASVASDDSPPAAELEAAQEAGALQPGDRVWVQAWGREGTLESLTRDGRARVRLGNVTWSVPEVELRRLAPQPAQAAAPGTSPAGGFTVEESEPVSSRLDVRGLERDAALDAVDRFLDRLLLQGTSRAEIVHGKGTGVLRRSIQEHLAAHSSVAEYRLGEHGEGGSGVTIVTLR